MAAAAAATAAAAAAATAVAAAMVVPVVVAAAAAIATLAARGGGSGGSCRPRRQLQSIKADPRPLAIQGRRATAPPEAILSALPGWRLLRGGRGAAGLRRRPGRRLTRPCGPGGPAAGVLVGPAEIDPGPAGVDLARRGI
jgi:hypothetical protein